MVPRFYRSRFSAHTLLLRFVRLFNFLPSLLIFFSNPSSGVLTRSELNLLNDEWESLRSDVLWVTPCRAHQRTRALSIFK
ncbi:Uncharacterised protein [Burkholderia pseudomallei]|nr:hypothetical protein BHT10_28710 [Burkholderia pseudomallei]OMQ51495.1 hypothetical protein AQ708_08240 [Burkholderia pseudomallei]OMQ59123.1 hypothetical protein AQ710_20525 [Burkholderia pseudomallei]OMQ59522.1 hypothetical protein AQ709_22155 [Burkholderia pseudomallei]OMQ64558.1 hypothetical protein AQ711_09035 [Burkholderia pseudomallei]